MVRCRGEHQQSAGQQVVFSDIATGNSCAELLLYCLASRARLYYCPACNASKVTGSHKLHTRNSEPQLQPAAPQSPRIQRPWDASFIDFRSEEHSLNSS